MTRAQAHMEEDLRNLVVQELGQDRERKQALAQSLGVSGSALEQLLSKSRWDMGLTFRLMDHLGLVAKASVA